MTGAPLIFEPLLKHRVWGGRRLAKLGKPVGDEVIGESWELADLPEAIDKGRSVVANGPSRGLTLHALLQTHRREIMGSASLSEHGGFPLLLKFLDARENLSVQVHPDGAYVKRHPGAHLKSEAWYIVEAEPGAVIYKGLRSGVSREAFVTHVRGGTADQALQPVPAIAGECHYLPSGTCHALGGGVLVAEVQTPSDTTFRVYDWGRKGRELHIDEALECISFAPAAPEPPALPIETRDFRTTSLCRTEYFRMERIETRNASTLPIVTNGQPIIWMFLSGSSVIHTAGHEDVPLRPGTTVLFPANIAESAATFSGASTLLKISLPDPLEGAIA